MVGFRIAKLDMAASEVGVSGSKEFCWFVASVETKTESLWCLRSFRDCQNKSSMVIIGITSLVPCDSTETLRVDRVTP
ncbi:hypothetical protein Tco_0935522 [Tanacetum coccineum]